ncbi:MAG: translocation/assembly module TamB [Bacteroidaceae bacterium]|nr:translocation/assembly module TamB [Bacteroidaceae bacterium]
MKSFLKWAGIILVIPFLLILLLAVALYIPPVQDYVVRKATEYVSEQTGMNVAVGRLRLSFPLDLDVREILIRDEAGDTLLATQRALVDLDLGELLHRRVGIEELTLSEVQLDSKDMVPSALLRGQLRGITIKDDIDLQKQHVALSEVVAQGLDLDVVLRESAEEEDTSSSEPLAWTIALTRAAVEEAHVRVAVSDSIVLAFSPANLQADSITLDLGREHLSVPSAILSLKDSELRASAEMDFSAFQPAGDGTLQVRLESSLGKQELFQYVEPWLSEELRSGLVGDLKNVYPDTSTIVGITLGGNMDRLALERAQLTLPGSVYFDGKGSLLSLADSAAVLSGKLDFDVHTQDLGWVRRWLELDGVHLPPMQLGGSLAMRGTTFDIDAQMTEGTGTADVQALLDVGESLVYEVQLATRRLNLNHFLREDSLGSISLSATAKGSGTDLLDPATRLDAQARLTAYRYSLVDLSGLMAKVKVDKGRGRVIVDSSSELLTATAEVNALLGRQITNLTFGLDLSRADLYALGLVNEPLKTAMCMHLDGTTNLDDRHEFSGSLADIILMPADTVFRPEDVTLEAELTADTTHVYLASGDLLLTADGRTGYNRLLEQLSHFTKELEQQVKERRYDTDALVHRLPQIAMQIRSGESNPAHDILKSMGMGFEDAYLDLNLDPMVGINGQGHILKFTPGAIQLDTIRMQVFQDSTGVKMNAQVHNSRRNPQITFDALLDAYLLPTGAGANLKYYDARGRKGIDLGMIASVEDKGFHLHFDPLNPVIAYRTFHLNKDNYIQLGVGNRVSANLDLLADDGTGLKLYSSPNEDALQDLSVALNHFNVGELMTVLPYAPHLTGLLHGDAHLIQTAENLSVSADLLVDNMTYEGAPLGQIGLQAVYLPEADGSHFVDGTLLQTGLPIATFNGSYTPEGDDGLLDITALLDRLPFSVFNGFIPDEMARLEGVAIGDIHIGGTTSAPLVNGLLCNNGLRVISDPYSLDLRFQDDSVRIEQSNLHLDQVQVYSTGKNPFSMTGDINFRNLDRITVQADMSAKDFELINAKKKQQSVAYGKVYVDFSAMLRGTLDNLRMFGRLKVLGDTDVTYVLMDSPLSVEDQLSDLVEFVDFEDSLRVLPEEISQPLNMNITMSVNVDDAAQVHCMLSPDGSSYIDLEGGGDLTMTYSPEKELQLNGRYTVSKGSMKYTMMIIPLKEFTIKNGSYAEFRGPLMNPTLNIAATERLRTTITENEHPRSVYFDVGMNLTQTLENLGLEFTLDAPEDMSLQNELASMSAEQRGRVAVTMLATGMYINESGSNGLSGQNALNAFLQSQVSNLTGKALKSVDLSIGVEQGTNSTGSTQTDYSFRFAKRFWNNRVSVILGGKVSSGENVQNTGETLIDNVSIEYRLDKSATRYVKLFYDKTNESVLDGEITEMGGSLVLRKKTDKLGELFLFRKKDE